MLRGSSDRYKSLWELTRDIALRALELAACQTAYWLKRSQSREEYKDREREIAWEGRLPDRTTFHFTFFLLFILHHVIFPLSFNYSMGAWEGCRVRSLRNNKQPEHGKPN